MYNIEPIVRLLLHWVVQDGEKAERGKRGERVDVRELREKIICEDEIFKFRERLLKLRSDAGYAIIAQK